MKHQNLSANFLTYLENGSLSISTGKKPSMNFKSIGNRRILDIIDIPIKLDKKPGLIKQLTEAKSLAKDLSKKNITFEIQLKGAPVMKLGKEAKPKLAKIVTLSSDIEITDLKKLKKLSDLI